MKEAIDELKRVMDADEYAEHEPLWRAKMQQRAKQGAVLHEWCIMPVCGIRWAPMNRTSLAVT